MIEGFYECPEIFELAVDENGSNRKWVVCAGNGDYRVGAFDGRTFTPESGKIQFSFGNCFYASQTYNNLPVSDGRRIQIAWGRVNMPGMPFNQMMLFPVELTLRTTSAGVRLFARPVREVERLYEQSWNWKDTTMPAGRTVLPGVQGDLFHVKASFRTDGVTRLGLVARGIEVTYDVSQHQLSCQKKTAPMSPENGTVQLELLVDRTSVEIFGNDGQIYLPIGVLPTGGDQPLQILAEGGPARLDALEVHRLGSAWQGRAAAGTAPTAAAAAQGEGAARHDEGTLP
jgi:sucrose-6-phosphate hydrolase SacC (GH32 family)